jgi:hypothetical protein
MNVRPIARPPFASRPVPSRPIPAEAPLPANGFLLREAPPLIDPDGVTDPVCLTPATRAGRLRRTSAQAAEALAVISSIVAVGMVYAVL